MPGFNNADQAFYDRFARSPGRRIFVNVTTGSDMAGLGDGSIARPYLTIARAVQDLRSGRNDVVLVTGDPTENGPVRVDSIDSFAIIGNRSLWSPGNAGIQQPTSSADGGGDLITYTFAAAHGFADGDLVVTYAGVGSGSTRPNGVAVVQNATATTLDLEPPAKDPSFSPNATEPFFVRPALQITDCTGVLVQGMLFGGDILSEEANGLFFRNCGDPRIVGCSFGLSILAISAGTGAVDIINFGRSNLIEGCDIIPTNIITSTPDRAAMPNIMIQGAADFRFVNNNFIPTTLDGGFNDIAWDQGGGEGLIHVATNPVLGATFFGNSFTNRFSTPLGGTPADYTPLFHLDDPAASNGLDRIFVRGNFFQDSLSGRPITVDDAQGLTDEEPATAVFQDYVPTWGEIILRRRLEDAIQVPGSVGETLARLAYAGAVHVDTAGGGTPGAVVGVNGLPENPVDNLTDARTIADAVGLSAYKIRGSVTITADHLDWTFEGENPEADVVTINAAADVSRSFFRQLGVRGDFSGTPSPTNIERCTVGSTGGTVTNLQGIVLLVNLLGTIIPAPGGQLALVDASSSDVPTGTTIDFNAAAATTVVLRNPAGIFIFDNLTQADSVLGATLAGAEFFLNASITAGIIQLGGYGQVSDSKTGATLFVNNVLLGSRLDIAVSSRATVNDILDEALATHLGAGTVGRAIQDAQGILHRTEIDQATNPWQEVVYEPDGTTVRARFDLFDQDNAAINNGNPLEDVKYVRRRVRT